MELLAESMRMVIAAEMGGAMTGLWCQGVPVLRPALNVTSVRLAACYPLVPYSNRIAHGQFNWQGQHHTLAANVAPHPHTLHGVGWQRAWQIEHQQADAATLSLHHTPDQHWPFAFLARQNFRLTPEALMIELSLQNLDTLPQPAGLGLHPFFVRRGQSRIKGAVTTRWDNTADMIPCQAILQNAIQGEVAAMQYDNCFSGWSGVAHIDDEVMACTLSGNTPYLVVYTPPQQNYFCVEPVSHRNNAINAANPAAMGLTTLQPEESMHVLMKLEVHIK